MREEDHDASVPALDDNTDLDRLSLASPLLGATGWIDGLARLVSIDTGCGEAERNQEFAAVLQEMFTPLGLSFQRLAVPGGAGDTAPVALLAGRRTGRKACSIYFHTDTAPAGNDWSRAPFSLTRQGSRLYGRGTTDMKGAIAAVWAALRAADAVGLGLAYDPVLLFCPDPMAGCHGCLRHLLAEKMVEGHTLYLNGTVAPRIWRSSPGVVHLDVRLQDRASDRLAADEGMTLALQRLAALQDGTAEAAGYDDTAVSGVLSCMVAQGGEPRPHRIGLCRSYGPVQTMATVLAEIEQAVRESLQGIDGIEADIRLIGHAPPLEAADQGPNGARWQRALSWGFAFPLDSFQDWTGAEMSPMGFVQQAGLQEVLLAGLRRPGSHRGGADEFTTVEDVEALARTVLAYLSDVDELPTY